MAGAVRRSRVTGPPGARGPSRVARAALAALLALPALALAAPAGAAPTAASLGCANVMQPVIVTGTTPILFVHGIDSGPTTWTQGSVGLTLKPPLDYIDSALGTPQQVTGYTFDWSGYSGLKTGSKLSWVTGPPAPGPGPLLAQAIKCVAGKSGHKVIIIAHSMGGLVTMDASTISSASTDIAAVFTLGTPYRGSQLDSAAVGPFLPVSQAAGAACAFGASLNPPSTGGQGTKQHAKPSGGIEALCRVVSQKDDPGMTAMRTDAAPGTGWHALNWPGGFPVFPLASSIQATWQPLPLFGPQVTIADLGDFVVGTTSELDGGTTPTVTCTVPVGSALSLPALLDAVTALSCFHTNEPDNQALLDSIVSTATQRHLIPTASTTGAPAGAWIPVTLPSPPGSQQSYPLDGVACPSPATCVAVGYFGPQGAVRNLAETLSNGTWTSAEPPAPALGLADPNPALDAVSCAVPGACVAAGTYDDQNSTTHGLVETLSNGAWTAAEPPAPSNATADFDAGLYDVSCPAPGSCVAVGDYGDQSGIAEAMTETLANGTWTAAEAPTPGGPPGVDDSAALQGVSCPAPGSCVAVGYYGQEGSGSGLIETLSGATWTPATALLPAGETGLGVTLYGVSCPALGNCVAVGSYTGQDHAEHGLIETLSGSAWTAATAPFPPGSATETLLAVACPASGTCAAVGEAGGHALIETLANGTWTLVQPSLPTGASSGEARLSGVACPANGTCVATGFYTGPDAYHLLGLAETTGFTP
jgi:pimeloyl-ACP methyl ester carboxylesterase